MTSADELRRENEALRNRISRLSAAVLRISASLDLGAVLHLANRPGTDAPPRRTPRTRLARPRAAALISSHRSTVNRAQPGPWSDDGGEPSVIRRGFAGVPERIAGTM